MIKTFTDINDISDFELAGPKGANLVKMKKAGINVPDGFVIFPDEFTNFININNIEKVISSQIDKLRKGEIVADGIQTILSKIINEQKFSNEKLQEIKNKFRELKCEFVAVRSSGVNEDTEGASMAGQFDSYLNVIEVNIEQAIKDCWISFFNPRALTYMSLNNTLNDKPEISVVVQKMVNSEVSGVAFSIHPTTNNTNLVVIEASFGLGEAIVQGEVTPDQYIINKEKIFIERKTYNSKGKGLFRSSNGENEWLNINAFKRLEPALNDNQIIELTKQVLLIEKYFNKPMDIEWAFEHNIFYIVQARPITTL
jgi:pyruvate, water dikinase